MAEGKPSPLGGEGWEKVCRCNLSHARHSLVPPLPLPLPEREREGSFHLLGVVDLGEFGIDDFFAPHRAAPHRPAARATSPQRGEGRTTLRTL